MSTENQIKGDSQRRQMLLSEAYAALHDLEIQDEDFDDLGVSAFKSDNSKSGGLGRFLLAVKEGKVAPGSYLLVESLDRLSRDQAFTAFNLFSSIVMLGITIVTLSDNQIYSQESIEKNPMQLMLTIAIMTRAHEESQIKSLRVSSAWEAKRKNILGKKMTAMCPNWLRLNEAKTSFQVLEERAEVVRQIFELTVEGRGAEAIARYLNGTEVPRWGRGEGWRSSYIKKLLTSRAVLGEFCPHKIVNGVRQPQDLIEDYYPPIISSTLFYAAQDARISRRGKGGPKGARVSNLFSGFVKCGYCGGAAYLRDRGGKGGKFVVCDRAQRGLGCIVGGGLRYDALELTFLKIAHEIDLKKILAIDQSQNEVAEVKAQLELIQADYEKYSSDIDKWMEIASASDGVPPRIISARLSTAEENQAVALREIELLRAQLESLSSAPAATQTYLEECKELIGKIAVVEEEDRIELRLKLQQKIRTLVKKIEIFPKGQEPALAANMTALTSFLNEHEPDPKLRSKILSHRKSISDDDPQYLVHFQSGRYCVLTLTRSSPPNWSAKFDTDMG